LAAPQTAAGFAAIKINNRAASGIIKASLALESIHKLDLRL